MKPVASLAGATLHVVSTREPGVLELQAGAELVSKLAIRQLSWMSGSMPATAEGFEGSWTFERSGLLRRRIVVRAKDSKAELAEYEKPLFRPRNGKLKLADGRVHVVRRAAEHSLQFVDDSGAGLFTIKPTIIVTPMAIELESGAARHPDLPWLLPLAAYIALALHMDLLHGTYG